MAIPAGMLARRFGYKGGILVGLVLIATGAFLVHPGHADRQLRRIFDWLVHSGRWLDLPGNHCQSLHHGVGLA